MNDEKRKGDNPIPKNLANYINDAQKVELHTIEGFGWHLQYVRRPLFQASTLIVANADGKSFAVIEENGELNLDPVIEIRH